MRYLLTAFVLFAGLATLTRADVVYSFTAPAEYNIDPIQFQFVEPAILTTETTISASSLADVSDFVYFGIPYSIESVFLDPGSQSDTPTVCIDAGLVSECIGFASYPPINLQPFDHYGTYMVPDGSASLNISSTPEPRMTGVFGLITLLAIFRFGKRAQRRFAADEERLSKRV